MPHVTQDPVPMIGFENEHSTIASLDVLQANGVAPDVSANVAAFVFAYLRRLGVIWGFHLLLTFDVHAFNRVRMQYCTSPDGGSN